MLPQELYFWFIFEIGFIHPAMKKTLLQAIEKYQEKIDGELKWLEQVIDYLNITHHFSFILNKRP